MAAMKVYPSKPVLEYTIKLSVCDAYSPKVWVTQCHFWPARADVSFERVYEVLKEGLGRTLAELPGFAGVIGRSSQDPRDLVVKVGADAHVDFTLEDLSADDNIPSFNFLETKGFPLTGLVIPFSAPVTLTPVSEGAPMLVAKLNKLKGGFALSFGFNHLLADASTVAEVERLWSLHTADVSAALHQSHCNADKDEAYRRWLSKPREGTPTFEDAHWKVFPTNMSQLNLPSEPVNTEAAMTMIRKAKEAHSGPADGDITKWCIWKLSPESLVKLKQDASVQDSTKWISTMDGLFWSRVAYIRQASKESHEHSEMIFPINIRTRLDPPIDPSFHGNCVDIVTATCPLADLETSDRTGLRAAAQSVRHAVTGWSQAKWEAWLSTVCKLPNDQAICPNPLILLESRNIAFNDYSRSRSHLSDWGKDLGRIARTRYMKPAGSMAGCATGVVVLPRLADGGLEVATTMTDEILTALEKDDVFAQYATLTCAYA